MTRLVFAALVALSALAVLAYRWVTAIGIEWGAGPLL